jgi:diacylglycerol O-acyltransferase
MQRMNGIDPMFIYSDLPDTPMEVAYACVFDPSTAPVGYSFEAVRQLLSERLPTLPPFRRRLLAVPFGLDNPRWVDDPDFDLNNHLHHIALPEPGGDAELLTKVAEVMGRPLSPEQPPWEMHVIEGLTGGRVGLIAKVHHAAIDGVAGAQLLAQLLDVSPDGRPVTEFCPPWRPAALPSGARLVTDSLSNVITSPIRAARAAREIGRTAARLARCAMSSEMGPLSIPLGAPTTFDAPLSADRAVSCAELSLNKVQRLKDRFGVTCNDVVLAVSSGALRVHLADHGQELDSSLVAIVPISVRGEPGDDEAGNRLSAMFVPLANERELPLDRLQAIVASCVSTKAQERAVGYGPLASAVSEALTPAVARPVIRLGLQAGALRRLRAGNLMVSNVPGPNFPLYFSGMRMLAVYPLGPVVDGVGLNITVQSYLASLFVGINAGATAVPDLPALARAMVEELDRLCEAADALGSLEDVGRGGLALIPAQPGDAVRGVAHRALVATR